MRRTTAALAILLITGCAPRRAPERWQAVEVPTDADFTGIWFSDSLNGWLAGGGWAIDGGIIGRTRDGGRTWRFESGILGPAARGASLGRIQMRDSLHGCVTTGNRGILVTDDGGSNWHPANLGGASGGRLYDLRFLDAWNGWAAGTEIARSEDAGTLVSRYSFTAIPRSSASPACSASATDGLTPAPATTKSHSIVPPPLSATVGPSTRVTV